MIYFLELGGYVAKESVEDVTTGPNLTDEQRTEFTDLARSRPYPVPYSMRESLRRDIADMIKMGVIRESSSQYASPVVVCVDYRKLIKLTVFDPEPMPTAEHLFQKLSGDKF